jgi:hypothetical protein
MLKKVDDIYNV